MRPIIGITAELKEIRVTTGLEPAAAVQRVYVECVRAAGGVPVVLPSTDASDVAALLDRLDGIVLTGGVDIDPARYDGVLHPTVSGVDSLRDEFEIELVRQAAERRFPMLALCRGIQILNVALGGTLFEDVPSMVEGEVGHAQKGPEAKLPVQKVTIEPGSTTAAALGCDTLLVNSIHHQAVRVPAPTLRVTGTTSDGVIEAVESTDDEWPMVAIQWHPEFLADEPSRRVFENLVAAAQQHRPESVG